MKSNNENNGSSEYKKANGFLEKGCKCGCSSRIPKEEFAELRESFQAFPKSEQDIFLMAQIKAMDGGTVSASRRLKKKNRSNKRAFYHWDHNTLLCQETYLNMLGIGRTYFENIRNHLINNGLLARVHGNIKRMPQWKTKMVIDKNVAEVVKNFLENYAEVHGLPSPGRSINRITQSVIFLPAEMSYKSVHRDFLAGLEEYSDLKFLKYDAFRKLWHQLTPEIQIMSPRTDLCDTCQHFRNGLHHNVCQEEEAKDLLKRFKEHLSKAKLERNYYNRNTKLAEEQRKLVDKNYSKGKTQYCSIDATTHYSYDWAQNVHIPHSDQQVSKIYYLSPRKVHLFGIQDEAVREQFNYVLDENEIIGKGPNGTLSMIFDGIKKLNKSEKHLKITCDNAGGQNKNNVTIWFYLYLVICGYYESVELNFMIPGHTKFKCDGSFGLIKKLYRKTSVNCVDHVVDVVKRSSPARLNKTQCYEGGKGFQHLDIKSILGIYFKKLNGLQKYQHFLFEASNPGMVKTQEVANGPFVEFDLLKIKKTDIFEEIRVLSILVLTPPPLDYKRQEYLYNNIHPFVKDEYKDITCPKPIYTCILKQYMMTTKEIQVSENENNQELAIIKRKCENLEKIIAQIIKQYHEPTREDVKWYLCDKATGKDQQNWIKELIKQLGIGKRSNTIIKIIEDLKEEVEKSKMELEEKGLLIEHLETGVKCHLDALNTAKEWRERQLAEKLEQLEATKNQEIQSILLALQGKGNELQATKQKINQQAQEIQQLKQELYLATNPLPALPRKKNKLQKYYKKVSEKIHLKKKQEQIIEVKPKEANPTHTNSFLSNLFLTSLFFKR